MNGSDAPPAPADFTPLNLEQALRNKAMEKLRTLEDPDPSTLSPEETLRKLHELRVHQIELEIQNEELRRTQVELEATRSRYFNLYDLSPVGYCTLDANGLIQEANLTTATLLGVPRGELTNKPISQLILKEDQGIFYQHRELLIETDIPQVVELRMVRRGQTPFWAQLQATTALDSTGAPVLSVVLTDITQHKQTIEALRQSELRESENRFRKLFKQHAAVMLLLDSETGYITDANEAAVQFYGWELDKLKQMHIQEINTLPPEVLKAEMIKASTEKRIRFEVQHRRADGSIRDVEVYSNRIESAGDKLRFSIIHDITERKQAEEVLQEEERYLYTILQTTSDGFWEVDVRGNITKVNETYCRMSGYTRDELLKLNISEIDANDHSATIRARIKRIIAKGSEIFETRHLRKDGSIFHVEVSVTYLNTGQSKFVCFCRDISERKQAEQALLQSEKDFARAQEVASIGSWRLDIQRNKLTWSDENHRIFGIPHGTPLTYETFLSCIHPDDCANVDAAWKAGLCGAPYDIEHRIVVGDQIKWVREKAYLEFAEDGVLIGGFGITQDITERKEAQLTILKKREDLQIILDSAPIMIFHKDCESRYIHVNKALAHATGLPKESMEGKADSEIFPSQAKYYRESDQEVIASGKAKHGIIQLMETVIGPRWVQTDKIPCRDNDGHIIGIIGFSIDITERRQAEEKLQTINNELERRVEERTRELQETQLQYLHAEKLSAIGKLSASIAHEFNNPLQGIMSVLKGLKKRAILEEEDKELLNAAIDESERIKKLIRSLQEFNRPSSCRKVVMDVHTSIDSLLLLHKSDFKNKRISVEQHYTERLPQIMAIPDQIKQVLLNLLTNAADACQQLGGIITIRTWQEGERIAISIQDTGVGIQPEHLDLIFQPFYTTKAEVKGTGLGLSVCHGIVKNHQGEFRVESKPGQGSTFTLLLPAQGV